MSQADSPPIEVPTTGPGDQPFAETMPSWLTSLLLHVALLLGLAMWTLPLADRTTTSLNGSSEDLTDLTLDEIVDIEVETDELELQDVENIVEPFNLEAQSLDVESLAAPDTFTTHNPLLDVTMLSAVTGEIAARTGSTGMSSSGLEGRGRLARSQMALKRGGNAKSEEAVAAALDWLARHQLPDGSWNFDHRHAEGCRGDCRHPGDLVKAPGGATGLALLPFLGAGNTHFEGKHRDVVDRGIYALASLLKLDRNGATVVDEGSYKMYCHGIATMALCEAYAMTHDEQLRPAAQATLAYTCYAQDPSSGGWRYQPRSGGDTSMHGWHVGALKSGYMAHLEVPELVVARAASFLDAAAVDGGTGYAYDPNRLTYGPATSAIGLLCRMYMGVSHENVALQRGIERLVERGPNRGRAGAYFNYYAAQAIFQYTSGEGPLWEKWNTALRDFLIESQETEGHESGSWSPVDEEDGHVEHGGRLYQTAMCCMTLEVYYRLMPIYQTRAGASGFE